MIWVSAWLFVVFLAVSLRLFVWPAAERESPLDLAMFDAVPEHAKRHVRSSSDAFTFAAEAPVSFDVSGVYGFAEVFLSRQRAVVLNGSAAARWPALQRWNASGYVRDLFHAEGLRFFSVHAPFGSHVRMHSTHRDVKLAALPTVNYTRPWREARMRLDDLFAARHCAYLLLNMLQTPLAFQSDVDIVDLVAPHKPAHQVNAWISAPTVTTPLHYDLMDNFYAQVAGKKRFLLMPPTSHWTARIHSALHPSSRQSHLDLENSTHVAKYAELIERLRADATEVVLEPGQVLFIPATWLHHVTTVGDEMSISVSIHTDTRVAELRELLLIASDHGVARHVAPHRARLHSDAAVAVQAVRAFARAFVGADSDVPRLCSASRWNETNWRDEDHLSVNLLQLRLDAEQRLAPATAPLAADVADAMQRFGAELRGEAERGASALTAVVRAIVECDILELIGSELLGDANVLLVGKALQELVYQS
jgi:hypothetical protein